MQRKSGYIEANGASFWVEESGAGRAVLLMHSGYLDSRIWDRQMVAFGGKYRVVRMDMRGFGRSSQPDGAFRMEEDVRSILDVLGIERAILNGCSMGGSIAVDFALSHPERVSGLILTGASMGGFPVEPEPEDVRRAEVGAAVIDRDENFHEAVAYLMQEPMWRQVNAEAQELLRTMFYESKLDWLRKGYAQPLDPPAFQRLEEIEAPTLVLVGERDPKPIQDIAAAYHKRIKGARLVWIADVGHLPSLEKPDVYNELILEFLAEQLQ